MWLKRQSLALPGSLESAPLGEGTPETCLLLLAELFAHVGRPLEGTPLNAPVVRWEGSAPGCHVHKLVNGHGR